MKDKIKKRWAAVSLIWVGAILLTCWNVHTMEKIKSPERKMEISRIERQFMQFNREKISSVLKKSASFHQSVESQKLGLISIENQLRRLLTKYCLDLEEVKTDFQQKELSQGSMPIMISFQGPIGQTMVLMNVLQKEYPFLLIKNVKVMPHQQTNKTTFQILFHFRYRISSGGSHI